MGDTVQGADDGDAPKVLRRPWVAFTFSFLNPGLGHIYCGYWQRGIALFAGLMAATALSLWILLNWAGPGLVAIVIAGVILPIAIAIDGYRLAKKTGEMRLRRFNRWYIYTAYYLVASYVILPGSFEVMQKYFVDSVEAATNAMAPAVRSGDDIVLVKPIVSGWRFSRGDVVAFQEPEDPAVLGILRIIGLEGESIEVKGLDVYVNKVKITERYSRRGQGDGMDFGPVTVPKGSVFLLGDNRGAAKDARKWKNPFLPVEQILGKAQLVYWNAEMNFGNVPNQLQPPPEYPEEIPAAPLS